MNEGDRVVEKSTGRRGVLWSPDGPSEDGKSMRYCVDWDDGPGSVRDLRELRKDRGYFGDELCPYCLKNAVKHDPDDNTWYCENCTTPIGPYPIKRPAWIDEKEPDGQNHYPQTRGYIYYLERQLREKDEIIRHLERKVDSIQIARGELERLEEYEAEIRTLRNELRKLPDRKEGK